MVKIQPCNKGCKKLITVQFDNEIGKYVPYEVDGAGNPTGKHNCPNSEYNRNKNQQQGQGGGGGGQQSTTTQQQQQTAPQGQATLGLDTEQKIMNILNSIKIDLEEEKKRSDERDEICKAILKKISFQTAAQMPNSGLATTTTTDNDDAVMVNHSKIADENEEARREEQEEQ